MIGIYVILAVSLNLIAGYTGIISIAHSAFYGIGAYVAALMSIALHTSFMTNVICAMILSGLFGVLVGAPSLRIREDYYVISSFSFQVIAFSILNNWVSFSGGPMGIPGIPQATIFGLTISSNVEFLLIVALSCAIVIWISTRIIRSPFGRVLKAIREDEVFALAAGKNIALYKILIFAIGSSMAALAGVLYAYYISFIDPKSFTVMESIFIISIVIIGGAGTVWGPVIGAIVLVTVPELLRFWGLPNVIAGNIRQIMYGALLVAFMLWRPRGLCADFVSRKQGARK
jgi:branched-chain amino acid transport system permease protein